MSSLATVDGVKITARPRQEYNRILSTEALSFLGALHANFSSARKELLTERNGRQGLIDSGVLPDFPLDRSVADSDWSIEEIPSDLMDRRVEITGPAGDRKMVINALNSGAVTYMADFEDSQSPTWEQNMAGQINLAEVVEGTISYVSPEGKAYSLKDKVATLIVRPRGLHLVEEHAVVDGEPVSASFFDFGLFLYNNFEGLKRKGSAPYFYLPKLEGRKEARLWESVLSASEDHLGIPRGTIKVTALIETLPAAFEMDEMLFELRRHITGLNCGRWDYIFSFIKKLRANPRYILPDRGQLTMDGGFLAPYVDLLIKTCHRRGAYAIGGMSAYIPVKSDEGANATAFAKVKADKEREFSLGHDGTWVAHPGLVPLAMEVFSRMDGLNQLGVKREEVAVTRDDLLRVPQGTVTIDGIRGNVRVGLGYLDSWLSGRGCVPIDNLMEDAATTEICRAQLWQWWKHGARLSDGKIVTLDMVRLEISSQVQILCDSRTEEKDKKRTLAAGRIFTEVATSDRFTEFITIPAYSELLSTEANAR